MFSTDAFNYVNLLDKAADASWTRENLITNNLANVNTPGYKRKDIDFESTLKERAGALQSMSLLTAKLRNVELDNLNPSTYTDLSNYSYRLDGNNVDVDVEEVELASEQIRYQGITTAINSEFESMRTVLK